MKGITPVIAIILLLLITISMVGFAFVWFSRVTQSATTSGTNQMNTLSTNAQKMATLETVIPGAVGVARIYIRVTGTSAMTNTNAAPFGGDVSVYDNNALVQPTALINWFDQTCAGSIQTSLSNGNLYCFSGMGITSGHTIRIQTPGGSDTMLAS
jgi:flagellin-like protein